MKQAFFRFYAELNDFLPAERRMVTFVYPFSGRQTVKHLIEAAGVPHTEVDLVLVNGQSVSFSYFVEDGDRVSVFPVFEAFDITSVTRVRPQPLRRTRFVLDVHLGRLAVYFRMLGFDAKYGKDWRDEQLARLARTEQRILLTRDRELLKRNEVTHGYCIRATSTRLQLIEVIDRFDLSKSIRPFTRCLLCNVPLEPASPDHVARNVPPASRQHYDEFSRCPCCDRTYWKGSHYRRMTRLIDYVLAATCPVQRR
jgi:uncharacterized protein with PIN domain/sulfur carrier protein ThiS